MKKNRIFGLVAAAFLLSAGACSNDIVEPGTNQGPHTSTDDTSGLFLSVDFKMPTGIGTRSETVGNNGQSDSGTEVGSDAENYVSSALIVLAATEEKTAPGIRIEKFGYIAAGEVPSNRISTFTNNPGDLVTGTQYRAIARLQKENLESLYNAYTATATEGETVQPLNVYVFVFANPTTDLINVFDSDRTNFGMSSWVDATCEVVQTVNGLNKNIGIWSANSFLMNNVSLATRELPKTILDWENFSSSENPFHMSEDNTWVGNQVNNSAENGRGAINVERSVARFDYKDGSPEGTAKNTYEVLMNTNANGDFDTAKPVVNVEIQKMCLVNMSNKFYYLPRTNENGKAADYVLCGREKAWIRNSDGTYSDGNYLVGPYANEFGGETPITTGFSTYFNFPFFEDNGTFNNNAMSTTRWDVVKVEDVLKGTPDKYNVPEGATGGEYRVWRYVTENLIPAPIENQVNGISTGIVFKGKLLGNEKVFDASADYYENTWDRGYLQNLANCLNGDPFTFNGTTHNSLAGNATEDPILYYYSGHLYMGWRHMRQAAIQASVTVNTAGAIEINRSNSLFKAVFGDGPIPPSYTTGQPYDYYDAAGEKHPVVDPLWTSSWKTDGSSTVTGENAELYTAYKNSPNFLWSVWSEDGRKEQIGDEQNGFEVPQTLIDMRKAMTDKLITIYQSSVDNDYRAGYYCYYYYWNRHNDNHRNGSMGPMEFDVVRNNVYKISVDNIFHLGHPRIPENDPNNPTPETPDESDEIYIDVKMEIVPWVVRVNSITF